MILVDYRIFLKYTFRDAGQQVSFVTQIIWSGTSQCIGGESEYWQGLMMAARMIDPMSLTVNLLHKILLHDTLCSNNTSIASLWVYWRRSDCQVSSGQTCRQVSFWLLSTITDNRMCNSPAPHRNSPRPSSAHKQNRKSQGASMKFNRKQNVKQCENVTFGLERGDKEEGTRAITVREDNIFLASVHGLCVQILICYCCTLQHNLLCNHKEFDKCVCSTLPSSLHNCITLTVQIH